MEKEYVVVVHAGIDLSEFDAELSASSGSGPIPNRSVDIANPRIGSKRMTHWMLTDAEAQALMTDPRVLSVEIPPDQRTDIKIGLHASQSGVWYRGSGNDATYRNWGLRRTNESTNTFGNATTLTGTYDYALAGTGVDIVIQDSGIQARHPEWNDAAGNTRLQQIDWYANSGLIGTQDIGFYEDHDGHGTHCAGIAAGKTFGWAKDAHIYSQKLAGLEGANDPGVGISIANAFDTIRIWHNNKTNGRPTVVNMSWGYGAQLNGDPISGVYRSIAWTYGVDYTTRNQLWAATGVSATYNDIFSTTGFNFYTQSVRVPSVDAEIEDMIAAGIHVCIAAGNNYNKIDVPAGADYNNSVLFGATTYNYHRGSSPYSENAFMVASIDSATQLDVTEKDKTAPYSSRGPGCNIWAPGSDIMSATSNDYDVSKFTPINYFDDPAYKQMSISGTSMASPQVAGLCALHLESFPDLTPAQLQTRIFNECKSVVYDTGASNDYELYNSSAMGTPNRLLYSKYGIANPVIVTR